MPAKSAAQKRLMDAAAHNPAFAKKVGIPTKVAKEFSKASKGRTFKGSGEMKESKAKYGMKKGGSVMPSKMGAVKTAAPSKDGIAVKGKTKGKMIAMRKGGSCK